MKLTASAILTLIFLAFVACGGGSKSSSSGGTSQASSSGPVTVAAGQTITGVDISVPATSSTPLNALVLGTADINSGGGSASNTGASVARGTQVRVLMFGPGLSGNNNIVISGPNDISISNPQTITSTKGTPGIEFVITVSSGAAVGARTVFLSDASGNVTTFTGGLEIQ